MAYLDRAVHFGYEKHRDDACVASELPQTLDGPTVRLALRTGSNLVTYGHETLDLRLSSISTLYIGGCGSV